MKQRLSIQVETGIELEAERTPANSKEAGVVAHPHPLFGGSMHNNVVRTACQALDHSGWTSLCFNFRGVGRSTGVHDEGRGEQDDLLAAVATLKSSGARNLVVIGYSFGAWVAAMAWPRLAELGVNPLLLIAPPVAFMNFTEMSAATRIGLIVSGELDQFGPPQMVRELARNLHEPIEPQLLAGADHFFSGYEPMLHLIITQHLGQWATGP